MSLYIIITVSMYVWFQNTTTACPTNLHIIIIITGNRYRW